MKHLLRNAGELVSCSTPGNEPGSSTLSGIDVPLSDVQDVYECISAVAAERPTETAIVHGQVSVTYGELISKVHQFRDRLDLLGAPAGSGVFVSLPRGIDCVIALLGTLEHRSHFVPMSDSEAPLREKVILEAVQPVVEVRVGDQGQLLMRPSDGFSARTRTVRPGIAYIMHTSGSTGAPKGVPISRIALNNLLAWYGEELRIDPVSRMAQLARPSFDFSIPELFLPLMHGGVMVIPTRSPQAGLIAVAEDLIQQRVTVVQLVPTVLRQLVNLARAIPTLGERFQRHLRVVVCNGESLPDSLRRDFSRTLPGVRLVNSYGPTEACVAVTWHWCSDIQEALPNIIGKPSPNVTIRLLGQDLRTVEVGDVGEICISGIQVTEGYLSRSPTTNLAFVDLPPGDQGPPVRLYRTGDYARLLPDGDLEFIERRDRQVQLRGVRVELGEIEAAVRSLSVCDEVRVVAHGWTGAGSAASVACFITPETVDTSTLASRLRQLLPDDRLPNEFRALACLPTTANGKVDDSALRQLVDVPVATFGGSANPSSGVYRTPQEALRESIATITGWLPKLDEAIALLGLDSLERIQVEVMMASRGYALPSSWVYRNDKCSISELAAASRVLSAPKLTSDRLGFARDVRKTLDYASRDNAEVVVVQSSLPDLVGINPTDAIEILLSEIERLSRSVTVALPSYTLTYSHTHSFNTESSPSDSGILSTHVMRMLGGLRTLHPAYSYVVLGPLASEIAEVPWHNRSVFGEDSIFGTFSRRSARYTMLATRAVAHAHRCEWLAHVPYHQFRAIRGTIYDRGSALEVNSSMYERDIEGTEASRILAFDVDAMYREAADIIEMIPSDCGEFAVIDCVKLEGALVPLLQEDNSRFLHSRTNTRHS